MFCLGCYFGDFEIVKILFKFINIEVFNNKDWFLIVLYFEINLLIIVCKYGYLDIVFILLEVDVDINIFVGFNIFLIVVCENE